MATTSLSQAYSDTHLQLHHIIPLDFASIRDLPESHQWLPDSQQWTRTNRIFVDDRCKSARELPESYSCTRATIKTLVNDDYAGELSESHQWTRVGQIRVNDQSNSVGGLPESCNCTGPTNHAHVNYNSAGELPELQEWLPEPHQLTQGDRIRVNDQANSAGEQPESRNGTGAANHTYVNDNSARELPESHESHQWLPEPHQLTQANQTHVNVKYNSAGELPKPHNWRHMSTTQTHVNDQHETRAADQPQVNDRYNSVVPVIDLTAPNVVELVGNACRKWGIFHVTNHDIPASVVDDVEAHARRLFSLPADRKLKALRSPNGAAGYGVARISPFFSKLMWHEGFTIMGSSAVDHAKLLWPDQYQEFCDAMENYEKKMKSLAYKILLITLKSLGVTKEQEETINTIFLYGSSGALQLNSYPNCPNPSRAVGLAPHTDSLLLTILHQNDTNGLQIFQENIGWISIPPLSGALTVNIGDLMHILSNACFPNVYHRVIPNETKHRFSIAYFYGPPADSMVAPLSTTPEFRAVTVKEYIGIKNKYLEKALSVIRI